ncbi:MAG: copper amine oxidase N-terminal domain-containing protein [Defluviitaleaceae bacterium]|nr:copper amine oxidase N-terminal domain-containing protein [Defluviitaleaceae bacterium]
MNKRITAALVALVMIFTALSPSTLYTAERRVLRFEIGSDVYTADGVVRKGNTGRGYGDFNYEPNSHVTAPVFIDPVYNRAMAPVYMIREALDVRMWFDCNSYVTFYRDGVHVWFRLGDSLPYGMGMPTVQQGTTGAWVWFAPLRYVAEAFGYEVIWDDAAQAVYIIER